MEWRSTLIHRLYRLRFALLVSLVGVILTYAFERWSTPLPKENKEAEVIGFIQAASGFHLRQKDGSVLWDPMQDGDPLYANDQIKTSSQGELTISLPSTGRILSVDTDSFVKLIASDKSLNVRVAEGYVTVAPALGNQKSYRTLIVSESESAQLEAVSSRSISYIKESASEPLREIKSENEEATSFESITWITPGHQSDHELNPDRPLGVKMEWKGSDSNRLVTMEWGPSRLNLAQSTSVPSQKGQTVVIFPIGKYFWRWSVVEQKTGKILFRSPISRLLVRGLYPPAVIGPTANQVVRAGSPSESIELKWNADRRFKAYRAEVSAEPDFGKLLISKNVNDANFVFKPGKYGSYYWRLIGILGKDETEVPTKVHAFKFLSKDFEKIDITWVTENGSHQKFVGKSPTLNLKWIAKPEGEHTYRVKVRPVDGELGRTIQSMFNRSEGSVPLDRAGTYQVAIEGVNSDGDVIGISPPLQVSVTTQPALTPPSLITGQPVANSAGQVLLQWNAVEGAREYQVEVKGHDGKSYVLESNKPELQLKKLMPGRYVFSVSAVDTFGRESDRSPSGQFVVPEKSSVRAPKIKNVEVE